MPAAIRAGERSTAPPTPAGRRAPAALAGRPRLPGRRAREEPRPVPRDGAGPQAGPHSHWLQSFARASPAVTTSEAAAAGPCRPARVPAVSWVESHSLVLLRAPRLLADRGGGGRAGRARGAARRAGRPVRAHARRGGGGAPPAPGGARARAPLAAARPAERRPRRAGATSRAGSASTRSTCSRRRRSSGARRACRARARRCCSPPSTSTPTSWSGANNPDLPPPFSLADLPALRALGLAVRGRRHAGCRGRCRTCARRSCAACARAAGPRSRPTSRDAMLLGGTVFDLLERERGARAAAALATSDARPRPALGAGGRVRAPARRRGARLARRCWTRSARR